MTEAPMTYAALAERLGITPDAVRQRARRKGWRTIKGNDGRVLVVCPPEDLDGAKAPKPRPTSAPATLPDTEARSLIAALERERARLLADLDAMKAELAETRRQLAAVQADRLAELEALKARVRELEDRTTVRSVIGRLFG